MILALLLGCAPRGVDADARATYVAVVSRPSGDLGADLARCAGLPDAHLAGDCALVVAMAADPPACVQVPAGLWQDECWFQSAEAANRGGDAEGAVDRCGRAGVFAAECTYHLWRQASKIAADPDPSVALRAIAPVHAAWRARLDPEGPWTGAKLPGECEDRRNEALFWCVFWTEEMGAVRAPDVGGCDRLATGREGCVIGGLTALRRRAVRARGGCDPGGSGPAHWASLGVDYVPDPRVELALQDPCRTSAR